MIESIIVSTGNDPEGGLPYSSDLKDMFTCCISMETSHNEQGQPGCWADIADFCSELGIDPPHLRPALIFKSTDGSSINPESIGINRNVLIELRVPITHCPWCGLKIKPGKLYGISRRIRRFFREMLMPM